MTGSHISIHVANADLRRLIKEVESVQRKSFQKWQKLSALSCPGILSSCLLLLELQNKTIKTVSRSEISPLHLKQFS